MWTGDSYLKRPCLGWCVVYGLQSITSKQNGQVTRQKSRKQISVS